MVVNPSNQLYMNHLEPTALPRLVQRQGPLASETRSYAGAPSQAQL